jgi:hypothetical protein
MRVGEGPLNLDNTKRISADIVSAGEWVFHKERIKGVRHSVVVRIRLDGAVGKKRCELRLKVWGLKLSSGDLHGSSKGNILAFPITKAVPARRPHNVGASQRTGPHRRLSFQAPWRETKWTLKVLSMQDTYPCRSRIKLRAKANKAMRFSSSVTSRILRCTYVITVKIAETH